MPLSGEIVEEIDIKGLSENENHDGERRLMYVALTPAERFLFIPIAPLVTQATQDSFQTGGQA